MVSIRSLWNHFFCLQIISAGIFIYATASLAANHTSAEDGAQKPSVEERTLVFPGSASLGALGLIPHTGPNTAEFADNIANAVGTVKVRVPKEKWLSLALNRQAYMHPELLDSCSAVGLDGLVLDFLAMDDSESGWCDAALSHANHFKSLKFFHLNRSNVSDVGMSQLKGQAHVECIRCMLTLVRGDCFKTFSQYKNLQILDCGNDIIKEENLKYLSDCPRLEFVDFRATKIGNVGVKYLSRCSNLTRLRIGDNPAVDDASIRYLLNLKHLKYLDLERTRVTFSGLQELKPMHLLTLHITRGMCPVKDLTVLKTLAKTVEISPRSQSTSGDGDAQLFAPLH